MAAQVELHGQIQNWERIKTFFRESYVDEEDEATEKEGDGWDNSDWGDWPEEPQHGSGTTRQPEAKGKLNLKDKDENIPKSEPLASASENKSWFDDYIFANSPAGDIFVVANGAKAVFLTSEWDMEKSRMKYNISYEGILAQEEGEYITSVACVPLISKKKSSPGVPDWSCIIVGFSRGHVRIYTEHGNTLLSQQFHTQRIIGFKLRSFVPSSVHLQHAQMEEIIILYRRAIVTIDGFGLFQTLRACRNNLAKVKAHVLESNVDPPPLSYKKWGYDNEQTTHDCEIIGLNTPSQFDHLFNASLLGGLSAKCKQKPPTSSIFVSTGQKPFVAFHYAQEGSATPVISDIAYAVASKVKSSIITAASGWLGFGGSATAKPASADKGKTEIVAPTPMSCRFALPDVRRVGKSVIMSPCRKLSAITDHLGRIMLIDNKLGIAIRIWKGYRDAECSWLLVDEDTSSSRSKHRDREKEIRSALFLVVYVPRRGQLEVFAMQQGPKVATFNVSKHGRLLSTTYAMMGINDVYMRGGNRPNIQCVFADSDANIYTFNIPFHLGLCDKSSSKVKDLHLLKSLQRLLKEEKYDVNAVLDLVLDIQTAPMINQSFKMLIHKCRKAEILSSVIETYLEKFSDDREKDLSLVFQLQSLMELYHYLLEGSSSPPPYTDQTSSELTANKDILFCLHATEKEMNTLSEMTKKFDETKSPLKSVSFRKGDSISVNSFFSSFILEFDISKGKQIQENHALQINFKSDEVDDLGDFIFCGCLNGTSNLSDWKQIIQNASLNNSELLKLVFCFWSRNSLLSSCYYSMMEKLYHLLKVLCDIEGYETVVSEFSQVSKWWETIRKDLTKSSDIFQIYSFALVCRGVAIDLQQQKESQGFKTLPEKEQLTQEESSEAPGSSSIMQNDDWEFENMSMDLLKWNLLIKQIEDLFLLSSVLMQRPKLENPKLPTLDVEIEPLSVINLLDRGKGCIAELVGKWLTSIGIDPALISDPESESSITPSCESSNKDSALMDVPDIHKDTTEEGVEASEAERSTNHVLGLIDRLKENFSVSLSSSIILSNYCWEYCLEFNKETRHLEYFESAISCAGAISSPFVRLGMISMIWSTFISKKLASLTSRSKTGKDMPLEKMSGFASTEKKQEFLRLCVDFLDLYMEASVSCIGVKPRKNTSIRNHWSTDANINASLADLALVQPVPNYEMILLHYQLALCSHFFHSFRIKKSSLKPIEMFDTKSRMLLFSPMCNTASYSNVEVDLALKMLREEFLCLVISNAIHGIPEELDSSIESSGFSTIIPDTEGVKSCNNWIQKCFELARIWGLDLDGLRINQVCEFYSNGLDLLGLELIGTVTGRDILGARLLVIAGMRISYIINLKRENVTEILSSLSTNLSNWLDSLDYSVLRCLRFSKTSIVELAQQVIQLIPETSYDYKLAEELLLSSSFL